MKIGDILSISENKNNKQVTASFKKKKLKEIDMDILDILNLNIGGKHGKK